MPYLTRDYGLSFAGGEPLLAFPVIRAVASLARGEEARTSKRARLSLTTNGSLLTAEVIGFLAEHRFAVTLSFDVLAQDAQRRAGSYDRTLDRLRALQAEPRLSLAVNSVFTARNVGRLARSLDLLMRWGVPRILFSLSAFEPWSDADLRRLGAELDKLRELALGHYRRTGRVPVELFAEPEARGVFACAGGKSWLSLAADGTIWGCSLFGDYFRSRKDAAGRRAFSFGSLARFRRDPRAVHARHVGAYLPLSQDNFRSPDGPCFLCPELKECGVCPMTAALGGAPLGQVPGTLCRIQKAKIRAVKGFREALSGDAAKKDGHATT